ncbi:MAG: putative C-S lyase [Deltaproteobacteria bacterium]|nr:putative C-S lyase [Deltaproteobacteria bacterium]
MPASPFDHAPDRWSHHSFKWNRYRGRDVLPLWVADMDFPAPPPVLEALQGYLNHGVLGYVLPDEYEPGRAAVCGWLSRRHGWSVQPDWIVWVPGVVPAFHAACRACCAPGDKVLVQVPNYPPLLSAPHHNHLERLDVPTVRVRDRWTLDFDALERLAADPRCRLFLQCSPMNPCGSVLGEAELDRVAEICLRHGVLLCSDEIHCDLVLDPGARHVPATRLPHLAEHSLTLMAASKTFNIAGLGAAFAVIPDETLRRRFRHAMAGIVPWVNVLGLIATEAALTRCDGWLADLLAYLRGNRDWLCAELNRLPGLSVLPPEATFLAWVDASGLRSADVQQRFEAAGVGPSAGRDFGWPAFARVNFGCPRSTLEEAVTRLARSLA